jgi:hypothetical protein
MPDTTFFRLLKTSIDDKGETLAAQITALNAAAQPEETFFLDTAQFTQIPGCPFAYWAPEFVFRVFRDYPRFEGNDRTAKRGPSSGDDFRRVRAWWEVAPDTIDRYTRWVPFSKGGSFSPYHFDIHLLVDWDEQRFTYRDFYGRPGREISKLEACGYFFQPGISWPRRPHRRVSFRVLPAGCIFSENGPTMFCSPGEHFTVLALANSSLFRWLASLSMGRGTEGSQTKTFEVGTIQRTPFPPEMDGARTQLAALAREAHDLQRDRDRSDKITHAFCLPGLVQQRKSDSLLQASLALEAEAQAAQARLSAIQAEIDDLVFDLYGLSDADRALVRAEMGQELAIDDSQLTIDEPAAGIENRQSAIENRTPVDEDEEATPPEDLPARVQNLLMWCVGVAFGRWDVRMALDPTLLPALQGPFEPLPRCAPGALVGIDGLPPSRTEEIAPESWLRARENVLDLPAMDEGRRTNDDGEAGQSSFVYGQSSIAWDGILVDDPTHPADIVTRVRGVLSLLWGDRAGIIEREACERLGFKSLRDYFRDPRKGFFPFHIKRYSKSRRKAPIYWLLQSERRNYAIWLYYHRLDKATLYAAGRDYADAKVALEEARLEELRQGLEGLGGSARRQREREIEGQQKLVAEVTEFRRKLDAVALLNLPPDLNDGVVISIAPLWDLVPWKEAEKTWKKLVAEEYAWSTMAKQMREKELTTQ